MKCCHIPPRTEAGPSSRTTPAGPLSRHRLTGRAWLTVLATLMMLTVLGCQESEEISRYQVPRNEKPPQLLLAAILPQGEQSWFFKLVGPEQAVTEHKEEFEQFVRSVRLQEKGSPPITWTVPEGWREGSASQFRYAAFLLGPRESPLEMTVSQAGGSVLANVNRWRGQLGLPSITEDELGKITREIEVDGKPVLLVEMKAAGTAGTPRMPPFASGRSPHPPIGQATPSRPTYQLPEAWKESQRQVSMSVATFEVSEGDQRAEVTVTPLRGLAGGLLPNVSRWRGQVGLGPVSEEELRKDLREIKVAGTTAQYVDLVGPESAGAKRPRILAVVLVQGDQTWFFKMTGPAELVGKQKSAFEAFVESVRFDRGTGRGG